MISFGFGDERYSDVPCAVTIGVFDGIHVGHQLVLEETVAKSKAMGLKSLVISFSSNPKTTYGNARKTKPLISPRLTAEYLINIGMDYHCIIDFSEEMSKLTGVEFIRQLCRMVKVGLVLVGSDFRCGSPAFSLGAFQLGDVLSRLGFDVPVVVLDPVLDSQGRVISSTLLRSMLLKGDVLGSKTLLGRPYALDASSVAWNMEESGVLLTKADSFVELLPKAGKYEASAVTEDGCSIDVGLLVSGSGLAFQSSESVKIDRILFSRGNCNDYKRTED